MRQTTFTTTTIALALTLTACGDAGPAKAPADGAPTSQPAPTAESETANARRTFEESARKRIDEIGKALESLKNRAATSAAEEKPALDKLAEDIRRKWDALMADLRELTASGADRWDDLKRRLADGLDDIEKTLRDSSR